MSNYDRRDAAVTINRLTPLTEEAAKEFKKGRASIETAYKLLALIEREAREQLPKHYSRNRIFPKPEDRFEIVADYAQSLREELDKSKVLSAKGMVAWFDELASETKAHMGE